MKESAQILAELRTAHEKADRDSFLHALYELVRHHRSWLEYRYGTFDERIEDGLQQAFLQALDHADFGSILHPDAYFKTVAINYVRAERHKARRNGSLEEMEEAGIELRDREEDPREQLIVKDYHRLLLEVDLEACMAQARRDLEKKAPTQAYLLTRRAQEDKVSYAQLAKELGKPDDPRTLTSLRVQYLRGRDSYSALFTRVLRKRAGENQDQVEEALMHYLNHVELYPPIRGVSHPAAGDAGG